MLFREISLTDGKSCLKKHSHESLTCCKVLYFTYSRGEYMISTETAHCCKGGRSQGIVHGQESMLRSDSLFCPRKDPKWPLTLVYVSVRIILMLRKGVWMLFFSCQRLPLYGVHFPKEIRSCRPIIPCGRRLLSNATFRLSRKQANDMTFMNTLIIFKQSYWLDHVDIYVLTGGPYLYLTTVFGWWTTFPFLFEFQPWSSNFQRVFQVDIVCMKPHNRNSQGFVSNAVYSLQDN